jgi:predicted Zn-dependent protease
MIRRLLQAQFLMQLILLQACTTNPVTGQSEFTLLSQSQEVQIGEQYYLPTQQSQGGELTIDPELSAYVSAVGQRLAAVSDRDLPYEFVVLNSSVPNAWALPGGKIAINRGLLTTLENEAELAAVLGHEIVHAAARHSAQALTRGVFLPGALSGGSSNRIMASASMGAQMISNRHGRDAEREADDYGIDYMFRAGYDPRAAVTLQEKFLALAQDEGRSGSWLEGLLLSHPPSNERLERNQRRIAGMDMSGRDLELGETRYRQALAFLISAAPAYELMTQAQQRLNDEDYEAAMAKLQSASEMLPQEARFYGLRGDILLKQQRYDAAVAAYGSALAKNDRFFSYHLGRGVANARLGNRQQARTDLERSASLLPTASAAIELGDLALAENDRDNAMSYYRTAAQSGGAVGERATIAYTRLDMPQNPATYIRVRTTTDDRGQLLARVSNASLVAAVNIQIEFRVSLDDGVETALRNVAALVPGETSIVSAGIEVATEFAKNLRKGTAIVVSATPA